VFETRWVLSYLAGPMTREQIKRLYAEKWITPADAPAAPAPIAGPTDPFAAVPPVMPRDTKVFYLPASGSGKELTYLPAVGGWADAHYSSARHGVDASQTVALAAPLEDGALSHSWDNAIELRMSPFDLKTEPLAKASFGSLPASARRADAYAGWSKEYLRWVRQNRPLVLLRSRSTGMVAGPGETEGAFRDRLVQQAREQRDLAVEKLRARYADRYRTLKDRLMRAEQALEREQDQVKAKKMESVVSFGAAILGAFLGRRGAGTVSRMGTAVKSAGRLGKEAQDVNRARETVAALNQQIAEMETRLQREIEKLDSAHDPAAEPLEEVRVNARSTDIGLTAFGLLWLPYRRNANAGLEPDWPL
jgi:hypothetical protein